MKKLIQDIRKENHQCPRCGKDLAEFGKDYKRVYCPNCRERSKDYAKKRVAAKICLQCGNPLPDGDYKYVRCPACRAENSERYREFKARHICVRCFKEKAYENFLYCAPCLEKLALSREKAERKRKEKNKCKNIPTEKQAKSTK